MCIVHTGGAFEVSTTTCRYYVHVGILDPCFFAHLFPRSVYALMLVYSCILMWFMCMIVNNIMCITHTHDNIRMCIFASHDAYMCTQDVSSTVHMYYAYTVHIRIPATLNTVSLNILRSVNSEHFSTVPL